MSDKVFLKLKELLPKIRKNVSLKNYSTYKIGGPAKYFFVAKNKDGLIKALKISKKLKVPCFVLGGGSNILFSDKGFQGLVIKVENKGIKLLNNNTILAGAGVELSKAVWLSAKRSLKGIEWAGGLPGTLGGAVRGNAGAFGGEIKDSILKVEALDKNFNFKKLSNKQCQFSYRSSIFKKRNWTVLSATIKLKKGDKKNIQSVSQSRIKYRKERHPWEYPNAGSIFKNCALSEFSPKLKKSLLGVVKNDPFPIIPTAYLIAESGLKGVKFGKAQISEKHPNFIVNLGGAKAQDVLKLIDLVKQKIKKIYNIKLKTEVQFVGMGSDKIIKKYENYN